ncbi:hypothetical protein LB505_009656 [Fusarium chuoi]|nr:hypothetical protein LB505_009656 [Fusarium chuoi]
MTKLKEFEPALQHARTPLQKETVAAAYGDHLAKNGHWLEAATVYGRSNKPFEDIALSIIDNNQPDALRNFAQEICSDAADDDRGMVDRGLYVQTQHAG